MKVMFILSLPLPPPPKKKFRKKLKRKRTLAYFNRKINSGSVFIIVRSFKQISNDKLVRHVAFLHYNTCLTGVNLAQNSL